MALALHHFIRGTLITTPPFIYIFVGEIPVNSLAGDVASTSQESNMSSDDPSALPLEDSINSDVLPPTPVNSLENSDLPPSDPVVDNGNAKVSDPGVSTDEPIVSKGVSQDTDPRVSNGPSEDGEPVKDDLSSTDDEEDEQEHKPDTSKNDELNAKLKEAGIDSSCFLPNLQTVGKCILDKEKMMNINFPQKDDSDDEDFEISGMDSGETVTLTIESGYDDGDFPKGGLRLTFNNPNATEVKITGGGDSDASLLPNIDHDYMFSLATDNWLDKTWKSLQKIGAKVGLNINDSLSDDECTPGKVINKNINVWKNKKEYVIGALANSGSECLMKHESDITNLLEGFKLTVKDGEDISLNGGEGPSKGRKIDTLKKNASYSFAPKRIKGKMVWFLIENS